MIAGARIAVTIIRLNADAIKIAVKTLSILRLSNNDVAQLLNGQLPEHHSFAASRMSPASSSDHAVPISASTMSTWRQLQGHRRFLQQSLFSLVCFELKESLQDDGDVASDETSMADCFDMEAFTYAELMPPPHKPNRIIIHLEPESLLRVRNPLDDSH
jgi:hypothetical protein